MAEDAKNNPSWESAAYRAMKPAWKVVSDISQGTLHLRTPECAKTYLPMEFGEDSKDFEVRLQRSILFNAFERTLHGLVGMVFRKDPVLSDEVPEVIRGRAAKDGQPKVDGLVENIDNAGNALPVFAKEVFTDAMRDGHAFILVDMPPRLPEGADRADEKAAGRRPYWQSYTADQALNWRVKPETREVAVSMGASGSMIVKVPTGRQILTQITFKECGHEDDGAFGEKEVVRYRVLRPGYWELWRETIDPNTKAKSYEIEDAGTTSLSEIPVAVIYSRKTGPLTSKPPLLDLALINLCHRQKYADYSTYLHISSRPILWFKGRQQNPIEDLGPYAAFDVEPQFGAVGFAETTGAALGAARTDIQDLESQMAALGLSVIAGEPPQPGTATKELLDSVQEESDLATAARSLKDAIERAFYFTAQFLDPAAKSGGSVELGATIQELTLNAQDIQAYSNLVALNQISLETMWALLARAGKLPTNFEEKKEKARLKKAQANMAEQMLLDAERGGTPMDDDEDEPDDEDEADDGSRGGE